MSCCSRVGPSVLLVAEVVEVGPERVGGDLAGASDVDGLDGSGVEEFVELGAADAERLGGFADGVDEPLGLGGGGRGRAPSVSWVGLFVRVDVQNGYGPTRAGARKDVDVRVDVDERVRRCRWHASGRG